MSANGSCQINSYICYKNKPLCVYRYSGVKVNVDVGSSKLTGDELVNPSISEMMDGQYKMGKEVYTSLNPYATI